MAVNELQAKITADISGLEKGLKQAEKLQDDYSKSIERTQKDIADNIRISKQYEKAIDQLNREFKAGSISQKDYQKQLNRLKRDEKETTVETQNLRKELTRLKREQKDLASVNTTTTKSMGGLKKGTANATPTLIEFSRVIQDAPYGIQGAANNIQQFTTNFGYLKKSAGGTIPALKSLAGSFLGPAGIVFAVSTVTSLLVTYGDDILSAAKSTDKLADATKEFTAEANSEILTLKTLVSIANDETKSKRVREQAVKKLNEEYKDYLGNLTLENIGSKENKKAVDELSKSLIRQAQIRGIQKIIEEKSIELAEDEISAKKDAIKETARLVQSNSTLNKSYREQREQYAIFGKDYKKITDSIKNIARQKSIAIAVKEETSDIQSEINELTAFLEEKLLDQFDFDSLFKFDSDAAEAAEKIKSQLEKINKELDKTQKEEAFINVAKELAFATKTAKELGVVLDSDLKIPQELIQSMNSLVEEGNKINEILKQLKGLVSEDTFEQLRNLPLDELQAFADKMQFIQTVSEAATSAISSAFSNLASQLSSAIEAGDLTLLRFKDIVNAVVSSVIQSLLQLASAYVANQLVETLFAKKKIVTEKAKSSANAVTIASNAAAALGPFGFAAFPALLAAMQGQIIGAFAATAIPFATGGVVPGGSFHGDQVPALLNSGEMVLNRRQQGMLLGKINPAPQSFNVTGGFSVTGDTLQLILDRADRRRNRRS